MGRKESVFRRLLDGTQLGEEALPAQPVVELLGDSRVLMEHHRGVTQYSLECIRVRVSFGTVQVVGGNLRLRQMTAQKLLITGRIDGVELIRGRSD